MKTKKNQMYYMVVVLIISSLAAAQDFGLIGESPKASSEFFFFRALICGVLLALALNLVLSNLAAAAGISIVSPEDKLRPEASPNKKKSDSGSTEDSVITKVNHIFGFWTMASTSICLFFACWFAIEISGALTGITAIVVSLAIWASFYLIMTALEAVLFTTVAGSLFGTAASVLRDSAKGIKSMFEKSPESKAADSAAAIAESVRDEIFGDLNTSKLKKQLQQYVEKLSPPSARDIKKELADLFEHTELNAIIGHSADYPVDFEQVVAKFEQESPNKERARSWGNQIREAVKYFKQQRKSGKDTVSAGIESALQMSGKSEQEAQKQREEIETYLRNSNKEELQPEELKHRVEMIFHNPKKGLAQIGESIRSIDHNTAVALLEQRKDVSHEEAENIANHFEQAMNKIFSTEASVKDKATDKTSQMKSNIESKLRNYLDSLDEPEMNYDEIKEEVSLLFHDPKAGADALITRLKMMDRDTIKSILESRKDISPERAEKIVSKIEESRDELIHKANNMKLMLEEKITQAREAAADTAEKVRKNAAIAAWWALGTSVVSGAASALGGFIAFTT